MSTYRQRIARVANSGDEEPGARDVHARICGGLGWATTQVYPAVRPSTAGSRTSSWRTLRSARLLGHAGNDPAGRLLPRLPRRADLLPARTSPAGRAHAGRGDDGRLKAE